MDNENGQRKLVKYLKDEISFEEWSTSTTSPGRGRTDCGAKVIIDHPPLIVSKRSVHTFAQEVENELLFPLDKDDNIEEDSYDNDNSSDGNSITNGDGEDVTLNYSKGQTSAKPDVNAFEIEMEFDREHKKQRKKVQHKRNRLPKALRGLMGEANLCFARGDHEDAIKMCMEIIRQAPSSCEPFQLLGMIYEEKGDMERSLQFCLIAAHLSPHDVEEWVKLAEMSLEQNNSKQAILCYNKALKYDSANVGLLWERGNLYKKLGDHKHAMESYQAVLRLLHSGEGDKYLDLAREISTTYHKLGETHKAIDTLHQAVNTHPDCINSEDVNMLGELYMSEKEYKNALDVIAHQCGIIIDYDESCYQEISVKIENIVMPAEIPIDLRVKFAICLIYLGQSNPLQSVLLPLFEESPDELGDLYLDVSEALVDVGDYDEAKPILAKLVGSNNYNLAAVWLRYAECVNSLGELHLASQCYTKVIELAPSHLEARLALSAIQQQLGHTEEALEVLSQDINLGDSPGKEDLPKHDVQLLHHKCQILHSQSRYTEFIENAFMLLGYYFRDVKPGELQNDEIIGKISHKKRRYYLQKSAKLHGKVSVGGNENVVSQAEWWSLYIKVCDALVHLRQYQDLEHLAATAYASGQFSKDPCKIKELDFVCLLAHYFSGNHRLAYNFIRPMIMERPQSVQLWNLFTQIIIYTHDSRHNRFCLRLMLKHTENQALCILNGHNAFLSGSLKHALDEYMRAYRNDESNPMLAMCIGLTFIQMASQKYAVKRHSLIAQGLAFFQKYLDTRGNCQEAYYNVGRAFHQLGLVHLAVHFYKRALSSHMVKESRYLFDLTGEIAYNLSLIYQNGGSQDLARELLLQHCVI
ncbi:general transcription factor 3C polypeptide 3-like isoform X2 [Ptychodera flava]|uniref:general transcription factor 3C polypeptide 3-like isoform X2 n=1 Tax=Ptychodera flava TaxID=63121 RepID=UPI00396A45CD